MDLPSEYSAERINSNNLKDFVNIHREAFKNTINIKYPKNKFNTIPISGVENIGYIIYHASGEPVAFYGVYPLYVSLCNKKVLTSQSGDTMTKPAHTGLGLFISSAKLTYNLCKENHINGTFGFPSPSSYRTFKKRLDWKFKDCLINYSFVVPTIPVAFVAEKFKFIKTVYLWWVRMILLFYRKSDFFEGSIIGNGQDGVSRDKAFWNYKMNARDNFAVKIGGTEIVFKTNGRLNIGDVNINNKSELRPLLRKLKLLSCLTFNAHVVFCVSPGTVLDEKLSAIKAGTQGLPIGFLNFDDEYDLSTLKFTFFDFDTF
jgi:hypothetical protein